MVWFVFVNILVWYDVLRLLWFVFVIIVWPDLLRLVWLLFLNIVWSNVFCFVLLIFVILETPFKVIIE